MNEIRTETVLRSEDPDEVLAKLIGLGLPGERAAAMLDMADEYAYSTNLRDGIAITKPAGEAAYLVETFQAPEAQS